MWSFITSGINYLMRGFLNASAVKFVVVSAVAYLIAGLTSLVSSFAQLVNFGSIGQLFGQLPDGLLFFLSIFRLDVGVPMILAAWAARFAIRRIPVIG
jgi:hypothetical protein